MTPVAPLYGYYDYRLVALSVFIAILAAYAALDLTGRLVTAKGNARRMWLSGGAIAMGTGIWAMHYIGMEAFHLPVVVMYDWPTVILSLFAAILASGIALFTVSRPTMGRLRLLAGAVFMGAGIAAMHYIGMEAMRLPAMCVYSPWRVGLSIALAIAIALVALQLTFALRSQGPAWSLRKTVSAVIMGLAIPVMHYVGMWAASFMPSASMNGSLAHAIDVSSLGVICIAIASVLVLGAAFLTSFVERRYTLKVQQLAKSELHLETIFDNLAEAVLVFDRAGKIVLRNKATAHLLSLPETEENYQKVIQEFDAFSPNGEPLPPNQWPSARALRGEFVQNFELLFRVKSTGEIGAREISSAPVKDKFGNYDQVIVTYRDITERRRLDDMRTRLATIVESTDDAIISKTETGIVTSWNGGAEKLFGYSAKEMIGQSIACLIPDDRFQEEAEILGRINKGETVDHYETVRKSKNGQLIHVSLSISPLRDGRGRIIGASKIARNITERKKLEGQLYQSQRMEAMGQLTGGIAHDFNNLLAVIIGNLDLLVRMVDQNEAALKRVQTSQKAAARGADLIRRLLAFSSNVELRAESTDLNRSVRNLIDWAPALGSDIKIATDLDISMPPVLVDAAGLESVLLNLAVNARDAMPRGGTLTISTGIRVFDEAYPPVQIGELQAGPYASISISDTGHGMSREVLSHAFEPFFSTKAQGKGTGLGLAMVYGFCKQSGGFVRIYSEPGYGTTVSLYLPFATGIADEPPAVEEHFQALQPGGSVLVVDDEPDLVEIAVTYLKEMGHTVYHAKDGASALLLVQLHQDIQLVLTDIVMPGGMNGVELTQKILESLPKIKIIYCSGFPSSALNDRSVSLVDGPLLHKPYQRAEFAAAVRAAMEGQ